MEIIAVYSVMKGKKKGLGGGGGGENGISQNGGIDLQYNICWAKIHFTFSTFNATVILVPKSKYVVDPLNSQIVVDFIINYPKTTF